MFSALQRLAIVIGIAVAFLFGLASTVYLSLRSPAVTVPEIVGKDRSVAENDLREAGLNFRVRAARPSRQIKPDTVMFQLPPAGQVVKAGQTVAVDIARAPKEGEASETIAGSDNANAAAGNENKNANESPTPTAGNENKPKRNKNTNANGNKNANANGNAKGNRNANAAPNANAKPNVNTNPDAAGTRSNTNNHKPATENGNSARPNRNANRNANRPAPAQTPPGRP